MKLLSELELCSSGRSRFNQYNSLWNLLPKVVPDAPGHVVLDFGCSTGEELVNLAYHYREALVIGVESDLIRAEEAQAKTEVYPNVVIQTPDVPFGRCNLILAMSVLCTHPLDTRLDFDTFDEAVNLLVDHLHIGDVLVAWNTQYPIMRSSASHKLYPYSMEAPWPSRVTQYNAFGEEIDTDRRFIFKKRSKFGQIIPRLEA